LKKFEEMREMSSFKNPIQDDSTICQTRKYRQVGPRGKYLKNPSKRHFNLSNLYHTIINHACVLPLSSFAFVSIEITKIIDKQVGPFS